MKEVGIGILLEAIGVDLENPLQKVYGVGINGGEVLIKEGLFIINEKGFR